MLADKAYDTNTIREQLARIDCEAVIPSKSLRKSELPYDVELYKSVRRWRDALFAPLCPAGISPHAVRRESAVECTFALFKQASKGGR